MPGFFTHYIAGQKVYDRLPEDIKAVIDKRRNVYNLGLQGPDFFNYFGAPSKGDTSIFRMSMMLHERSVDEWMSLIYRYIAKQEDADREIILPYFYGYLVHYAVDCAINPYISYRVGFGLPNTPLPERFGVYRKRFCVAVDEIMLKKHLNKLPSDVKIDEMFWVTYAELLEVCRMYPVNIKTVYGKDISREEAIKAYQDMNKLLKKRIHPGIYKMKAAIAEATSSEFPRGFYRATQYGSYNESLDYMNDSHTEWALPWDSRYTFTTGIDDLFEKGIDTATILLKGVSASYNGQGVTSVQAIHDIGGNSFMTGITWNAPMLMKFYDCIFKAEEEKLAPKLAALQKKMDEG